MAGTIGRQGRRTWRFARDVGPVLDGIRGATQWARRPDGARAGLALLSGEPHASVGQPNFYRIRVNERSPEDDRQTAQRDIADATPSAQRVFQDAVNRGQEVAAADEFERDSAEYRRQYWNRLAKIDYQIAIAGTPAASDAEFIASGRTILEWLREHQLCDGRSRVLDIGCGVGRIAFHVAPLKRIRDTTRRGRARRASPS